MHKDVKWAWMVGERMSIIAEETDKSTFYKAERMSAFGLK